MVTKTTSYIGLISPEKAGTEVKQIYKEVEAQTGQLPNLFKAFANSPQVLSCFWQLSQTMRQLSLSPRIVSEILLLVSEKNRSEYCISAHTATAKKYNLSESECQQARQCEASNPKEKAVLNFTKAIVDNKGAIKEQEFQQLKAAGVNDTEMTEIFFVVTQAIFGNYFAKAMNVDIDFPHLNLLD